MKKKSIRIIIGNLALALISFNLSAQTIEMTTTAPGNSKTISTSVSNGVTSTYSWSTSNATLLTGVTGTADKITVVLGAGATDGQSATISVEAISDKSCHSAAKTLTIVVKNPANVTFKATFGTAPGAICQNEAATFSLTFTGGNVTSYKYFVDADKSGTLSGTETEVNKTLAVPGTSDSFSATFGTDGTAIPVIITSVTGTVAGSPTTSPQTGVSQGVDVNKAPTLGDFVY